MTTAGCSSVMTTAGCSSVMTTAGCSSVMTTAGCSSVMATAGCSSVMTTAGCSGVTTTSVSSGVTTIQYRACQPSTASACSKMSTFIQHCSQPSISKASNIILLTATDKDDEITIPPEHVQEKTVFIFNNLSQLNLTTKWNELKEVLTEEYYPWLSQYIVVKRVSVELNFHALYSKFLDVMEIREVNDLVMKETYRNIKVLLHSDKDISNFSNRSLLKNLGHWLGMITLRRNRPILFIDIDLKGLVLEAYHKGLEELLFVVPFVAKILQSCLKSMVFKPPNPWTMAIINVLAELHQELDLKLNLKFEVEILYHTLGLDINKAKPSFYLNDPKMVKSIAYQMSRPQREMKQEVGACAQVILPPAQVQVDPPNLMTAKEIGNANQMAVQTNTNLKCLLPTPEPKFSFTEVDLGSNVALAAKMNYCPSLPLFQTYPHLIQFIQPSIERSIQEWIHPVVERAINYTVTTCEHIIRKDFSLDPNEVRLQTCAHHFMRNLTAGMAMITCREKLLTTVTDNLKVVFTKALLPSVAPPEFINAASATLAQENMEVACAIIQKTAVEKALPELDKRLLADFNIRKIVRADGNLYNNPSIIAYQTERVPDRVRLRPGGPGDDQIVVYEEFDYNIPGFLPIRDVNLLPKPTESDKLPLANCQVMDPSKAYGSKELSAVCGIALQFLQNHGNMVTELVSNMRSLIGFLINAMTNRDFESWNQLLHKAVQGFIKSYMLPAPVHIDIIEDYRDIHLRTLRVIEDIKVFGHFWTIEQITKYISECPEEMRYNVQSIDSLIRNRLIDLPKFNIAVTKMMDNGKNSAAVSFAMKIVQLYLVDDRNNINVNEPDLYGITDMLIHITSHNNGTPIPEGLTALIENLRVSQDPNPYLGEMTPIGPTGRIHDGIRDVRMLHDDELTYLVEMTERIMREWQAVMRIPGINLELYINNSFYTVDVNLLLLPDDMITQFLRIATQMAIKEVYKELNQHREYPPHGLISRDHLYEYVDNYVKLLSLLIRHTRVNGQPTPKLSILNKVLGIITGCLLQDYKKFRSNFHQLPYYRLLLGLYLDMNTPDPFLEAMNFEIVTAYCHVLRIVKPTVAPGFAYAWLDLLSHRSFICRLLPPRDQQKGWALYYTLLIDLLKFMKPFLRNNNLTPAAGAMYKGALKLFLVILHDFPEFLCDNFFGFCQEIPANCIQLRNIILSSFPRNIRMPNPFLVDLKVDLQTEITKPPRTVINYDAILLNTQFRKILDVYLTNRSPVTFLSKLKEYMQITNETGCFYNTLLINAVVLYVGMQAIAHLRSEDLQTSITTITNSSHMDILQSLITDLDFEGRYLFLNAIGNQLRYPNSHTHYFSCALLYLFAETNSAPIKEQISRMLIERLIGHRPHPWGVLVTLSELTKNPAYKFWDNEFVKCSPEIKKMIVSIAESHTVNSTKPDHTAAHAAASDSAPVAAADSAFAAAPGSGFSAAPGSGFSAAPGSGFSAAPGSGFSATSGSAFAAAPGSGFSAAPGSGFSAAPGSGFSVAPGSGFSGTPGSGFSATSGSAFAAAPGSGFSATPGSGFTATPGSGFSVTSGTPGSAFAATPGSAFSAPPGFAFAAFPGSAFAAFPGSAFLAAPGAATSGSAFAAAPGSAFAAFPGSAFLAAPGAATSGSAFAAAPGSAFAAFPGSAFATFPCSAFAATPGSAFATFPGSAFAATPGSAFAAFPGSAFAAAPSYAFAAASGSAFTAAPGSAIAAVPDSACTASPDSTCTAPLDSAFVASGSAVSADSGN